MRDLSAKSAPVNTTVTPILLNAEQASAALGISEKTLWSLTAG